MLKIVENIQVALPIYPYMSILTSEDNEQVYLFYEDKGQMLDGINEYSYLYKPLMTIKIFGYIDLLDDNNNTINIDSICHKNDSPLYLVVGAIEDTDSMFYEVAKDEDSMNVIIEEIEKRGDEVIRLEKIVSYEVI